MNRRSLFARALALLGVGALPAAKVAAEPELTATAACMQDRRLHPIVPGHLTVRGWTLHHIEGGPIGLMDNETLDRVLEEFARGIERFEREEAAGRMSGRYCVMPMDTRRPDGKMTVLYFERPA